MKTQNSILYSICLIYSKSFQSYDHIEEIEHAIRERL